MFHCFFLLYYVLVYGTYSSKHRLHLCIVFIYKCKHNILRFVQCYLIVADEWDYKFICNFVNTLNLNFINLVTALVNLMYVSNVRKLRYVLILCLGCSSVFIVHYNCCLILLQEVLSRCTKERRRFWFIRSMSS